MRPDADGVVARSEMGGCELKHVDDLAGIDAAAVARSLLVEFCF